MLNSSPISSNANQANSGLKATWSPAAKSAVGRALSPLSRISYTLGRGIVNEVFFPAPDQAAIRDFEFILTGPEGYFSEEQKDCHSSAVLLGPGVPSCRVENLCIQGRYRLTKEVIADPHRDVLLQHIKLKALRGSLKGLRLFCLLAPRLEDQGSDNSGWIGSYRGSEMLFAQSGEVALALATSAGWVARTATYAGPSDAWHDLRANGQLVHPQERAEHGHIALAAEIDLAQCGGDFVITLAFGNTPESAGLSAVLSLNSSFDSLHEELERPWKVWQKKLKPLDKRYRSDRKAIAERNRPDRSRPRPTKNRLPEDSNLFRQSMMVLQTHRSDQVAGAGVASLSIPWGEIQGDDDYGYHLVWSRDLVEEAIGLLAGGAVNEVKATLDYLSATQKPEGGWPKNMRLDGRAFSPGVQLDEAALPILLVNLAHREGALGDAEVESFWPMVRRAAGFIILSGPSTGQDRWENTPGLSPYTLATEIAALLFAARLAERFKEPKLADFFRTTADLWNDSIESWTYVRNTPLAQRAGVEGYYVRIAPSPGMFTLQRRGEKPHMKQAHDLPVEEVVSPDALCLVRFGLRSADDPRIINTIKVVDMMTRVELPAGACWRRYNGDYYGEYTDGSPFLGHDDKRGIGRPWPLLTGERGHYEIAVGNLAGARRLLATMEGFASQIGLLSEQVWDEEDIPEHDLFRGRPSGSAMPLAWTHAEYVRLLRSIRDKKVYDQPADTLARYIKRSTPSQLSLWRFDHQSDHLLTGRKLRLEVMAPAVVRFSTDDWKTFHDIETKDTGLGFYFVDLPTSKMKVGGMLRFTFRWPEAGNHWEGCDFELEVIDPPAVPEQITSSRRQDVRKKRARSRK
ncbi:MAG TPA: glycoside hydrolase family 15 protein [Tepidisphaeraceae bacterium]|jgi:glucoamylase|nr:glycoside hydrolase family 15 protein [Tepidisphaeraceae bacterium]